MDNVYAVYMRTYYVLCAGGDYREPWGSSASKDNVVAGAERMHDRQT